MGQIPFCELTSAQICQANNRKKLLRKNQPLQKLWQNEPKSWESSKTRDHKHVHEG